MASVPLLRRRAPRGSVLVLVLVTLVFVALLLTRFIETGSPDLLLAMRRADRARLVADAHAALETTLAVLMDFRTVDGALQAPAQGWADPLALAAHRPRAGVTCEVTFEDESAKLSLPRLAPDALAALLAQLGLAPADATRVADALSVWMRRGYPAADSASAPSAYARDEPPAAPPYRPLRSFAELAEVRVARDFFFGADGRPTPLLAAFERTVSLYHFERTNLNSAPEAVLLALGWDRSQVATLRNYLASTGTTPHYLRTPAEARRLAGNPAMHQLGVQVQLLRINVTVREGAARLRLSALVTWAGQASLSPPVTAAGGNPAGPGVTEATGPLHYPFTVLEFVETTPPDSPSLPDAPAA